MNGYGELPWPVVNPDGDVILFVPKGTPLPPNRDVYAPMVEIPKAANVVAVIVTHE